MIKQWTNNLFWRNIETTSVDKNEQMLYMKYDNFPAKKKSLFTTSSRVTLWSLFLPGHKAIYSIR